MDITQADKRAHAELLGEDALEIVGSATATRVYEVRRGQDAARVHGIPVGPVLELPPEEVRAVCAALLDASTWRWDRITRHRPVADTLFEVEAPSGTALVGLDRRGGKLGVVRAGQLQVADVAPGSAGVETRYGVAARAATAGST